MVIRPIPLGLLKDRAVLLTPSDNGYLSTELTRVRTARIFRLREYNAETVRDNSQLILYYDCVNSLPKDVNFAVGMLLIHKSKRYEILTVEELCGEKPHHFKITARAV